MDDDEVTPEALMGLEVSRGSAMRKAAGEAARLNARHITVEAVTGADGGTWWQWTLRQVEGP